MTAVELKEILIHRIREIDDISFLNAIKTILDFITESQLTEEQKKEIMSSKEEIKMGRHIDSKNLEKDIETWLKAK